MNAKSIFEEFRLSCRRCGLWHQLWRPTAEDKPWRRWCAASEGAVGPVAVWSHPSGSRIQRSHPYGSQVRGPVFVSPLWLSIPCTGLGLGLLPLCVLRDLEEALEMGVDWSLREGYAWAEDKEHCEEYGRMLQADPNKVSSKAKKRGLPQVQEQPQGPMFSGITTRSRTTY